MLQLKVVPGDPTPLVDQIVGGIRQRIDDRLLRAGARLPSIRTFAAQHGISRFTVVEAYDRLVALGYLASRRGSGFYVASRPSPTNETSSAAVCEQAVDIALLIRDVLADRPGRLNAGGGCLPSSWLEEEGLQRQVRELARQGGSHLTGYGHPMGYPPLREQLRLRLEDIGIAATADQILLTHGGAQALDLVIRYLLRPGDSALVDDPGYYNLFGNLKLHGVRLLGVPRNADGPDLAALEKLAAEHRPKVFFTQSVLHNPTGSNLAPHIAFRLLQAADRHGFVLVEDDVLSDFQSSQLQRLATLDQLNRVIYLGSFSKTLSASLRVGYLVAHRDLIADLTDIKLLSDITSSEFAERLVYQMLIEGHYRKYIERLRDRLARARDRTLRHIESAGMQTFPEPAGGLLLWAKHPAWSDAVPLANAAAKVGIFLAPGSAFRPYLEPSPYMRLNVAYCETPRLFEFLSTAEPQQLRHLATYD